MPDGPARSGELLRSMLEQSRDHALILLDPEGRVVDWLMGAVPIFGYEREQMLGRTIECLFTPADLERRAHETERQIAARQGRAEDDRWMVRRDGALFWASGFVSPLRDARGAIIGFCKLVRDRTDVRGQVETLRNRAEALAGAEERKMLALAKLAHELRNPLGVIGNAAEIIERAGGEDGTIAKSVALIRRQNRYVSSLIENLLDLVRARAGKAALQPSRLELAPLLAEVIETASAAIGARAQRVELLLPPRPVVFRGDAQRLKQVFGNLLSNASKFSPNGATIWVKGTVEDDEAVVRVKDEGHGIGKELLPRVFELFVQAEPGAGAEQGLGLGLSIVKEYVTMHGGTVQVRSDGPGRGSELAVRLPLAEPSAGLAAAQ
ncbi:MAG TPA: PAS domain-containing sensor histidine kinase [Gammaproteobacteria bacterium]